MHNHSAEEECSEQKAQNTPYDKNFLITIMGHLHDNIFHHFDLSCDILHSDTNEHTFTRGENKLIIEGEEEISSVSDVIHRESHNIVCDNVRKNKV